MKTSACTMPAVRRAARRNCTITMCREPMPIIRWPIATTAAESPPTAVRSIPYKALRRLTIFTTTRWSAQSTWVLKLAVATTMQLITIALSPVDCYRTGPKFRRKNVGLSLYDVYGNVQNGSMYNDNMYNNTSGWMCWASRCAFDGYRNDAYLPLNTGDYALNPSIAANPIPLQMEAAEYATFQAKLSSNGVVVGPVVSSGSTPPGVGSSGGSGTGPVSTLSTAWYNVVNTNSSLCVDAAGRGTANGTIVQQ